jgi:hypothetical protein
MTCVIGVRGRLPLREGGTARHEQFVGVPEYAERVLRPCWIRGRERRSPEPKAGTGCQDSARTTGSRRQYSIRGTLPAARQACPLGGMMEPWQGDREFHGCLRVQDG